VPEQVAALSRCLARDAKVVGAGLAGKRFGTVVIETS
jgi:hypothetical protein